MAKVSNRDKQKKIDAPQESVDDTCGSHMSPGNESASGGALLTLDVANSEIQPIKPCETSSHSFRWSRGNLVPNGMLSRSGSESECAGDSQSSDCEIRQKRQSQQKTCL